MKNIARNLLIISALLVSSLGAYSLYLAKQDYSANSVIFNTSKDIAINGYDTVAYQKQKEALRGDPEFQVEWAGSIWFFTNIENRDIFAAAPKNYAPLFGGYDPLGISKGYTNPTDPTIFTVKAGQTFLHYSPEYLNAWEVDRARNLILANSNWVFLREKLLEMQNDE